ncbi:MAG: molybdate ABC transporter permease subunit, partial [Candidatus Adiutrix sp.]
MLTVEDISAIKLSLKLALATTFFTILIGAPLALWLSRKDSWWRRLCGAIVTMPLILPPTVLGFYLLVFLGPLGPGGQIFNFLGLPL